MQRYWDLKIRVCGKNSVLYIQATVVRVSRLRLLSLGHKSIIAESNSVIHAPWKEAEGCLDG